MALPKFLNKYFWDIDAGNLKPEEYPYFVIERILEYGDKNAVKWMFQNFQKSQIKKTLSTRRGLSSKSAIFWSLLLGVPKDKILCLSKSSQKRQKGHWLS